MPYLRAVPTFATCFAGLAFLVMAHFPSGQTRPNPSTISSPAEPDFPLETGTYWVYEGTVTWAPENSAEPLEVPVQWRMSVERVVRRNQLLAAVVSGFPRQLDGARGDEKPAKSLIVEKGAEYFWIAPDAYAAAMIRLGNPKDSLEGLVTDDQLFLSLPLTRGKKFCNAAGMIRTDQFYCWVAGEPSVPHLDAAKGIPAGPLAAFPVKFQTMEDITDFVFVPRIGIVSYSYQRHGTVNDTELQLSEFHRGAP